MGHVDHAHQAIGDGQTQRHQQQNRAQADAREQGAESFTPSQRGFDVGQGGHELGFDLRVCD